jgi:hypothetical protein
VTIAKYLAPAIAEPVTPGGEPVSEAAWASHIPRLDARRLLADKPSPRAYFDQMIDLYPDRLNVGPLWYGAVALLSLRTNHLILSQREIP